MTIFIGRCKRREGAGDVLARIKTRDSCQ